MIFKSSQLICCGLTLVSGSASTCKLTMSNIDIFAMLIDVLTINPFIAGTVFIRQNLTSADFRS